MTEDNGYCLNELGCNILVKAIKNCSEEFQEELANELSKIRSSQI